MEWLTLFVQYGVYPLGYGVAIFVIRMVVQKQFKTFRILLVAPQSEPPQVLAMTWTRTFRIWWTFCWRTTVYLAALLVALYVPSGFIIGAVQVIAPAISPFFPLLMGIVLAAAVGLFAIYSNILDERIADFTVTLAPRTSATTVTSAATVAQPS
jgi:hypothetical protein